jgi:hypothetical protein
VDFHATLCKGQQQQGAAEEQARIWLAESTGSEQAPTFHNSLLLTFSCSWRVSVFNHTNGRFNSTAQPPQPTTPAPPAADLTLTKDVQYSLAPDERIIHELLKPTRPI